MERPHLMDGGHGYYLPCHAGEEHVDEVIMKKGTFCYEYLNSENKLSEKQLPTRDMFYNRLINEECSHANYDIAKKAWFQFDCDSLKDYLMGYLRMDVYQLADIFINYTNMCKNYYGLYPVNYVSLPGLSLDAALKSSNIMLDLITDRQMLLDFKTSIRGGLVFLNKHHSIANIPKTEGYDPKSPQKQIIVVDENNLYGFSMQNYLPKGNFKYINEFDFNNVDEKYGYFFVVDLAYPSKIHDLTCDFPLASEHMKITDDMLSDYMKNLPIKKGAPTQKLTLNQFDKIEYKVFYPVLKFYLEMGMKITKIHRIIKYDQEPFLKSYIDFNSRMRQNSTTDFGKSFFKLLNNSVFGKLCENLTNRTNFKLCTNETQLAKVLAHPQIKQSYFFDDNLTGHSIDITEVEMNRPLAIGSCILDLNALVKASGFKRKLVLEWLEKQPSYTLHRQVKKRYKTSQVKVPGINHQFQADLMDVSNLSKYNDNYKFILTVIDCFSRLHVTYKMDPIFEAYRQPSLQLGGGYIPVYQGGAGVLSDIWRFTKPIIHRLARPALGLAADILVKKKSPKAALKRTLINETIQEKSVVVDIHPISAQSGSAPIEFFIPGDGQYYIDLNDTILALDVKLNKPVATEKTAPVNQLISSLFSNLELTLNDTQVEGGSHLYSYKSYFNTLLQYGKDAKETHLRNYGFYKDEPKKFDDITGDGNAKRLAYQGKTMYLNGAIFADIFHQPRYLLPHVNVRLRFTRQPEKFSLVNFTDTVIETNISITKAIMYVRKVRVSPSVGLAHEEGLKTKNAIYPLQKHEVVTYTIPQGTSSHVKDNIFQGRVPKAIYIGLVTNDAFAGSIKHNPFNFRHFNCNFALLTLDGENIQQPFSPNFKTHDCAREYMSLYHSLNLFRTNGSCGITIDDFKDGNTIFGFNLCPDQVITGYAQPRNYGQLKLELKFMESLPKTINVIMFAIFDGNIEITKERNVIIN
ncbi:hypothetical protein GQR58_019561 [Nymphon striatum]|nr:hypothetical protein GQR58_019561 [Nymphon striatum]